MGDWSADVQRANSRRNEIAGANFLATGRWPRTCAIERCRGSARHNWCPAQANAECQVFEKGPWESCWKYKLALTFALGETKQIAVGHKALVLTSDKTPRGCFCPYNSPPTFRTPFSVKLIKNLHSMLAHPELITRGMISWPKSNKEEISSKFLENKVAKFWGKVFIHWARGKWSWRNKKSVNAFRLSTWSDFFVHCVGWKSKRNEVGHKDVALLLYSPSQFFSILCFIAK